MQEITPVKIESTTKASVNPEGSHQTAHPKDSPKYPQGQTTGGTQQTPQETLQAPVHGARRGSVVGRPWEVIYNMILGAQSWVWTAEGSPYQ